MLTFPKIKAFVNVQISYYLIIMLYRSIENYLIQFKIQNLEFNALFNGKFLNFKGLTWCFCVIEANTFRYFRSCNDEREVHCMVLNHILYIPNYVDFTLR